MRISYPTMKTPSQSWNEYENKVSDMWEDFREANEGKLLELSPPAAYVVVNIPTCSVIFS
jgi:hypothetical protein